MKSIIQICNVNKAFSNVSALQGINLEIQNGEFLTLLGPSGCGKTTLLRLLAGFEQPNSGQIILNQQDITHLPPEQRHVNMVFQSYALFPHMTVYENIAFGLRCQKIQTSEIDRRIQEVLVRVKLDGLSARLPHQLSGGQQQRVAIARAVVNEPLVLLLDEPLSALDYSLRKTMRIELKELQRRLGITFVFVTHDQEEALAMSDRVVVLSHGQIEQIGTPRAVYEEPLSLFVARFVGETNIFHTKVLTSDEQFLELTIENKQVQLRNRRNFGTGEAVAVILRPEDLRVWGDIEVTAQEQATMLPGVVTQVIYKGSTVDLLVRLPSGKIIATTEFFDEDDEKLEYQVNEKVWVEWMHGWEVILKDEAE